MPKALLKAPWPPKLASDETVLAEGAGTRAGLRRHIVRNGSWMAIVFFNVMYGLDLVSLSGEPASLADRLGQTLIFTLLLGTTFYWMETRHLNWMLTSKRFFQRGKGEIPRGEIASVTAPEVRILFGRPRQDVIVRRAGPDMRLTRQTFTLGHLEDPEGVRETLERLK